MADMPDGTTGLDDEAMLLAAYAAGDQAAARTLSERLLPGVLRHAYRVLGDRDEAEDVAQDAMMRLWKQAADWRAGEAKISTWLYRVTQNLCIDRIRKRRPSVNIDDAPEPVDPATSVLSRMVETEEARSLVEAIGTLPDRQRQALVLRHFDGCSNPEIGARLDCSVEAVESLLARARRQLAKLMTERRAAADV